MARSEVTGTAIFAVLGVVVAGRASSPPASSGTTRSAGATTASGPRGARTGRRSSRRGPTRGTRVLDQVDSDGGLLADRMEACRREREGDHLGGVRAVVDHVLDLVPFEVGERRPWCVAERIDQADEGRVGIPGWLILDGSLNSISQSSQARSAPASAIPFAPPAREHCVAFDDHLVIPTLPLGPASESSRTPALRRVASPRQAADWFRERSARSVSRSGMHRECSDPSGNNTVSSRVFASSCNRHRPSWAR